MKSNLSPVQPSAKAWYRDPFRWLVITPPTAAVLAGIVTLWLAISSFDGMVVDDYYKQGLQINQTLARDERAHQLGLSAHLAWQADPVAAGAGTLHVLWNGGASAIAPGKLDLKLIYATRAGLDRELTMPIGDNGNYAIKLVNMHAGQWYAHLSHHDWRVVESFIVGR